MSVKTLFILAVLLVALGGAAFLSRDGGEGPGFDASALGIGANAIYVAEQTPGPSIVVSIVRLEKPGYVVIHEDAAGAPGTILGASSLLPAGEAEDLPAIELSRSTRDGETVYAMLHADDGDGAFDATRDMPVLDTVSGAPMMMIVTVSRDAADAGEVSL